MEAWVMHPDMFTAQIERAIREADPDGPPIVLNRDCPSGNIYRMFIPLDD